MPTADLFTPRARAHASALALAVFLSASGCLEDPIQSLRDAAADVPADRPVDASVDVPADVPTDLSGDAPVDVPVDATPEVSADVPVDVPVDATPDATLDVALDTAIDVAVDATADVGYFGPSRCADSGFAICEDFEGDAGYDRDVWTPYASNGTLAVETTRAARGSHALHAHTHAPNVDGGAGASVGLRTALGFPRIRNTYFGRAFVWMEARSPSTHSTLFESGGRIVDAGIFDGALPVGGLNVSQRFSISGHQLEASYDSSPRPPTTDYSRRSASAMPLDRWACLEWHFKGDSNELHFWLDGVELVDMSVLPTRVPTWFAPDWVRVNVGLQLYRPDTESDFDLWIDEVAINPTRVGCTR